ncbi:MAG: type II toxin-antitoxin system RelE/ParE family toxin [bacterium]|nr:type II toxin-antitoxin system RelE/ParE family toxin [bacterium]
MVKRLIWSKRAKHDRKEILEYWINRTGNIRYSLKLKNEFDRLIKLLIYFPKLGKKIDNYNARYIIKGDYKIFYDVVENYSNLDVRILHIWDMKRDPDDLEIL